MNVSPALSIKEEKENLRKALEGHNVTVCMPDDYIHVPRDGKAVRAGRKTWAALYRSVTSVVSA